MKFTNSYHSSQNAIAGDLQSIYSLIQSQDFIGGKVIDDIELALAQFTSSGSVVTCGNGTDALLTALEYFRFNDRRVVFCPAYTFVATVEAILLAGFEPWFIDIDYATLNIDPQNLQTNIQAAQSQGRDIAGVVCVDIFGNPCNYKALSEVCSRSEIFLICDGAQSLGAKYMDNYVSKYVDALTTSFYPTKPLGGLGDGGAIISNNHDLIKFSRRILRHDTALNSNQVFSFGRNSRLDTINGAFLLRKFDAFLSELEGRRKLASHIQRHNSGFAVLQREYEESQSSWCNLSFRLPSAAMLSDLAKQLGLLGIETRQYYSTLVSDLGVYDGFPKDILGLQQSRSASKNIISIPSHGIETSAEGEKLQQSLLKVGIIDA